MRGDIGFDKMEGGPGVRVHRLLLDRLDGDLKRTSPRAAPTAMDATRSAPAPRTWSAPPIPTSCAVTRSQPDRRRRRLRRARRTRRRRRAARRPRRRRLHPTPTPERGMRKTGSRSAPGRSSSTAAASTVGATLVVRGTDVANDLRVALSGGRLIVSDSRRADPNRPHIGCEASGGSALAARATPASSWLDAGAGNDRVADRQLGPEPRSKRGWKPGRVPTNCSGGDGGDIPRGGRRQRSRHPRRRRRETTPWSAPAPTPTSPSRAARATLIGGQGADVMVGGDPCDGDVFDGGPGNDDANFFRFTPGVNAQIGGPGDPRRRPRTPGPDRRLGRGDPRDLPARTC